MSLESPPIDHATVAQGLWDAGAWNADGKPDVGQGQSASAPLAPAPAAPAGGLAPPEAAALPPEGVSPAPAEPEGPEYEDLADYLTKSKLDAASFYQMPVKVTVDGQESRVPLADLLKSYQLEGHFTQKSQKLADQEREFQTQRQTAMQQYQQQMQAAQQISQIAHQIAFADFQGIPWEKLAAEDPSKYVQYKAMLDQRQAQVQSHLQQLQAQTNEAEARRQQELTAKILPQERERLYAQRPEWRDEAQFSQARTRMAQGAKKLGFSDAELNQVYDHRYMIALDLASQFLDLQARAPQVTRQVRSAPLMPKPGARQNRDPHQVVQHQAKEQFLKNRRDPEAQAKYAETLM